MDISLKQEGKGSIELEITDKDGQTRFDYRGIGFKGHSLGYIEEGFSGWHSKYDVESPTAITARADMPDLEMRIALRNTIDASWEGVSSAALPPYHFQMGFTPHIDSRASFKTAGNYESFDIHFKLDWLEHLGIEYPALSQIIDKAQKNEPAELSQRFQPCPPLMLDAIQAIGSNLYSPAARQRMLGNHIENILLSALEVAGKKEMKKLFLSPADIEGVQQARALILQELPIYPGNKVLIRKAGLNAEKLHYGFKQLFQQSPIEFFRERRMIYGKELLLEGITVAAVAYILEYSDPTTFIKEFKKLFFVTPGEWVRMGRRN